MDYFIYEGRRHGTESLAEVSASASCFVKPLTIMLSRKLQGECFKICEPKNYGFFHWNSPFQNRFWKTCTPLLRVFGTTQSPNSVMFPKKHGTSLKKIGAWRLFQVRNQERNVFQLYLHSSLQNNQTFHVYPTPPSIESLLPAHLISSLGMVYPFRRQTSEVKFFQQISVVFVQAFGFIGHSSQIWT